MVEHYRDSTGQMRPVPYARIIHEQVGDCSITRVEGDPTMLNGALAARVALLERELAAARQARPATPPPNVWADALRRGGLG